MSNLEEIRIIASDTVDSPAGWVSLWFIVCSLIVKIFKKAESFFEGRETQDLSNLVLNYGDLRFLQKMSISFLKLVDSLFRFRNGKKYFVRFKRPKFLRSIFISFAFTAIVALMLEAFGLPIFVGVADLFTGRTIVPQAIESGSFDSVNLFVLGPIILIVSIVVNSFADYLSVAQSRNFISVFTKSDFGLRVLILCFDFLISLIILLYSESLKARIFCVRIFC